MTLRIPLTAEECRVLSRQLGAGAQKGGFQLLIARLQKGCDRDEEGLMWLTFSPDDGVAIQEYSKASYGPGTYQTQLRSIAPKVLALLRENGLPASFRERNEARDAAKRDANRQPPLF